MTECLLYARHLYSGVSLHRLNTLGIVLPYFWDEEFKTQRDRLIALIHSASKWKNLGLSLHSVQISQIGTSLL